MTPPSPREIAEEIYRRYIGEPHPENECEVYAIESLLTRAVEAEREACEAELSAIFTGYDAKWDLAAASGSEREQSLRAGQMDAVLRCIQSLRARSTE